MQIILHLQINQSFPIFAFCQAKTSKPWELLRVQFACVVLHARLVKC